MCRLTSVENELPARGTRRAGEAVRWGTQFPEDAMRPVRVLIVALIVVAASAAAAILVADQAPAAPAPSPAEAANTAAQAAANAAVPRVALEPGLSEVPDYNQFKGEAPAVNVPDGFTPIFNGKDLSGWHISKTARHGHTPDFRVVHGVIAGTQQPWGHGGLLITDKKYRNFEMTLEVKPDWGCDSGIFFRTTETGIAYQITMDYLGNGNGGLARMIAEGGISLGGNRAGGAGRAGAGAGAAAGAAAGAGAGRGGANNAAPAGAPAQGAAAAPAAPQPPSAASLAWKREAWNLVRVRVEGVAPKLTVWINGQLVNEQQDTENHAFGGMVEGPIALQVHGGSDRWTPAGYWRWRNLGIKELP